MDMNLLIIGHSVVDKVFENDSVAEKPGGIIFSMAALQSFITEHDEIFISTALNKKYQNLFKPVYRVFNQNYIEEISEIPTVDLIIHRDKEREEKYSMVINSLSIEKIDYHSLSGIYINMVSGFEISLDQMRFIRKVFKGLIYFDVHTFSRGVDNEMKREFRRIPDFKKWAECINILQANESELKTLTDKDDENEIAIELISYGIDQVIVTKGENGALIYFRDSDRIVSHAIHAAKVNSISKIGCGDVFGALYFYNYISNKNKQSALNVANMGAAISTTYSQISQFRKLRNDVYNQIDKK